MDVDLWLICSALLALIPIASIVQPGMPNTSDGQVHLLRTLEVIRLLRAGVLYPRWAPDFYLGFGYPFFEFYAPGAHLLAAWLALTGLGAVRGIVALQVGALLLYPTGAFLAARSLLPAGWPRSATGPAALVSAALYLYAPFRWRELFLQGNISQLLALAWLPWCAWLLIRAAQDGGLGRAVVAGTALAALVYAHHPSAFLAFPSLGIFSLILIAAGKRCSAGPRLVAVCGAFILAVALSAPFWLPALVEMHDVNFGAIGAGSFNAQLNLLPLRELLALPAVQDDAALNPPMPNSLGIAQAVLALPGLLAGAWWIAKKRTARQTGMALLGAGALLVASLALILPGAAPIWVNLPLAQDIAFPWRLLGPALLWAAILGGSWLCLLPEKPRLAAAAVLLVLIPVCIAPYLFPRPFAPAPEPGVADIARYELQGGARGTASANEYLPRWVQDPNPPAQLAEALAAGLAPSRLDMASLPAGSQAQALPGSGLGDRYRVSLTAAATVRIQRFYFPGWQAWVDGHPAPDGPGGPYGEIQVPVPAGEHEIALAFGATPDRAAAAGMAGAAVMVVAAAWVWQRRKLWTPHIWTTHVWTTKSRNATKHTEREDRESRAPEPASAGTCSGASATLPASGRGPADERRNADAGFPSPEGPAPAGSRDRASHQPSGRGGWLRGAAAHSDGAAYAFGLGCVILLVALLKIGAVGPLTRWFRERSPEDSPAAMQHPVHASFADGVELLGYDLSANEVRQGDELDLRLYWRGLQPHIDDAQPFVHLDAITGDVTWANETKLNPGDKPIAGWISGFYVVDDYQLAVPATSPPVIADLRAGLLSEGKLVPLSGGGQLAGLGRIRILERRPAAVLPGGDQAYRLGQAVRLAGYQALADAQGPAVDVTLDWQATEPVPVDYTVFLHVTDASGRLIAQGDGPPLHGWYPSSSWAVGQVVVDDHRIALPAGTSAAGLKLALGLYTLATGARGDRQPEDQVVLAVQAPGQGGR